MFIHRAFCTGQGLRSNDLTCEANHRRVLLYKTYLKNNSSPSMNISTSHVHRFLTSRRNDTSSVPVVNHLSKSIVKNCFLQEPAGFQCKIVLWWFWLNQFLDPGSAKVWRSITELATSLILSFLPVSCAVGRTENYCERTNPILGFSLTAHWWLICSNGCLVSFRNSLQYSQKVYLQELVDFSSVLMNPQNYTPNWFLWLYNMPRPK